MKRQSKPIMLLLTTLILLALPTLALATSDTRLRLSTPDPHLMKGDEVTIEVLIEDTEAMYGAETHLSFDPQKLAVVDADPNVAGIKLHSGPFLDPEQGFILQNQADNQGGTIDYAVALLNPAPAIEGSGLFFSVTFRAKKDGPTTIKVEESLFSTRDSKPIEHTTEDITLQIGPLGVASPSLWIIAAIGVIIFLILLIILTWRLIRAQKQATAQHGALNSELAAYNSHVRAAPTSGKQKKDQQTYRTQLWG